MHEYLRRHEAIIAPLYKAYSEKYWDLATTGRPEHERAAIEAKQQYLKVYSNREEFQQVRKWHREMGGRADGQPGGQSGQDEIDRRQIELIYFSFVPNQLDELVLQDIVERETHIENQFHTFRPEFDGGRASENQLREILKSENDIARRKAAWEASKRIGAAVANDVLELVRIRNREAQRLGFRDHYAMMLELQELDERRLFGLLDDLEKLSESAFTTMKAELDAALKGRFGVSEAANHPWLYADPFFQDSQSARASDRLDEVFRERSIEKLTLDHFQNMGLEIDGILKRSDLYEREGKSQHAFCMDVDRAGDVRILCNIRNNEQWMSTMLHEFGHGVYDLYNDRALPFLLRAPSHTLTTEAIAMLNGRMTRSPQWLTRIAGVSETQAREMTEEATGVLKAGMLIFLRWGITLVRFERELYRDPGQQLNSLWWDLVERIQKITPPPERDQPHWASKIHLATAPVYYQNYILGELMASQLLHYMERTVLHSESIVGRPEGGDYLIQKIFRPGSRRRWDVMLRNATGESLNPEYFVRQFVA